MKRKANCIELRNAQGKVLLSICVYEEEINMEKKPESPPKSNHANPAGEETKENNFNADDPPMSDAQKRYLFRILAERGIEGDKAHKYLKDIFQVDSLKQVTKADARQTIERLLAKVEGGVLV